MNDTLKGMKSMDEEKYDLISLICRVLTSYKPPTLQPGSITEKVAWLYLWQIANEFVIFSLLSVERLELEISQP